MGRRSVWAGKRSVWVWGGVVALACGWGARAQAAEKAPVFRFSPGDKTTRVVDTKATQVLQLKDGPSRTRVNTYQEKQVSSRTEEGFAIRSVLQAISSEGGSANVDPMLTALKQTPLTLHADAQGKLLSIDGLDKLAAVLRKTAPAGAADMVTPEFLLTAQQSEWQSSVTDYIGRPAQVGEAWVAVEQVWLPDGHTSQCYVAKKVTETTSLQGRPYVRVQTVCNSDPGELRTFLGAAAEKALTGLKPFPGVKVSGTSSSLLDPQTLNPREATLTRRVEGTMTFPGLGAVPIIFTEERTSKEVPGK